MSEKLNDALDPILKSVPPSRRGFLKGLLAAGGIALLAPASRAIADEVGQAAGRGKGKGKGKGKRQGQGQG